MSGRPCVALWAAALLSRVALGLAAAGPVVRCEPCDARAREACKPLSPGCAEAVREPGCGCCLTCALAEGRPCGVYTERCGAGLTCRPPPGQAKPLQALLDGRGLCTNLSAAADAGAARSGGGGEGRMRDLLHLRADILSNTSATL
uniref:Insulin-like growth factor-binding protein 3 n=1 Tax=Sphaerodactylus townsendi TaxID=933632 RepID=A0ACB8FU48_9SAUR